MNITSLLQSILLVLLCFSALLSHGQSLPVGTPVLEDYYRRAQLLGQVDSSISFTSRPFFPTEALKIKNAFNPELIPGKKPGNHLKGIGYSWGRRGFIQLLPVTWQQQFNTHHPYSLNDGAMIPARGYQTMISGGFFVKAGPLSIQFRPEVVMAENKPFETFTNNQPDQALAAWYNYKNNIDLPEYFPGRPYKQRSWGQSSVRLTFGPVSAGLSSENMWWGPGIRNSLMMSNSGAGFNHFTLNTVKPVSTPIGSFEGQIIGGRLESSGFFGADTNLVIYGAKQYRAKREDWRYLNGIVVTWQPRWVPGLFLGATRCFMDYGEDLGSSIKAYFPIITPIDKKSNYGDAIGGDLADQIASVFIRWILPKEHTELYIEYGREDHAYDMRDLALQPDYSRAYVVGMRKLFPLTSKDNYIQVNMELTQTETKFIPERGATFFYTHTSIRQGYTNQGQLIGAGIGPGSSMQTASVSWGKGLKSIGVQLERYVHNNNFFYDAVKDIRAHWVDINASAFGEWDYGHFLFSARLEVMQSLNYEYHYLPVAEDHGKYWSGGMHTYNFQANMGVTYRF